MMAPQDMPAHGLNRPIAPRSMPSLPRGASEAGERLQGSAEILVLARRWYERELERAAAAHGARWPAHCEWITAYLDEELRERLTARGWGANDAV